MYYLQAVIGILCDLSLLILLKKLSPGIIQKHLILFESTNLLLLYRHEEVPNSLFVIYKIHNRNLDNYFSHSKRSEKEIFQNHLKSKDLPPLSRKILFLISTIFFGEIFKSNPRMMTSNLFFSYNLNFCILQDKRNHLEWITYSKMKSKISTKFGANYRISILPTFVFRIDGLHTSIKSQNKKGQIQTKS